MQIYNIETNEHGKELTVHGSTDFPCAVYDEKFSEFLSGEVPWHWHGELEIVLVVSGRTQLECLGKTVLVNAGEVVLINANALHKLTNDAQQNPKLDPEQDCHILNVVFDPKLLGGLPFSRIYKHYVAPIIHNAELPFYLFSTQKAWHQQVIDTLKCAFLAWQSEQIGYELTMSQSLLQCWQLLCQHEPQLLSGHKTSSSTEKRIQTALQYIHRHFAQPLSVQAISQAANISESECYRLFKHKLHCTPNQYLLSYRLRHAATLLLESNLPITTIAQNSGFNCSAYFGKKFRQAYQQTPKQYRKQALTP